MSDLLSNSRGSNVVSDPVNTSSKGIQIPDIVRIMLSNDGNAPVKYPDSDPVKVRYITILQTIQNEALNRKMLGAKLDISDNTLKRDISKLVKLGLIQYKGSAKRGWYELTEKIKEQL